MNKLFESAFGSLISGVAEVYLSIVYLAALFLVIIFKPQRIKNWTAFRRSYYLFTIYVFLPALINAIVYLTMFDDSQMRNTVSGTNLLVQCGNVVTRFLFALSILNAFISMTGENEQL